MDSYQQPFKAVLKGLFEVNFTVVKPLLTVVEMQVTSLEFLIFNMNLTQAFADKR